MYRVDTPMRDAWVRQRANRSHQLIWEARPGRPGGTAVVQLRHDGTYQVTLVPKVEAPTYLAAPVIPGGSAIRPRYGRLVDAKFAAECLLWAYGLTFDHVEDRGLRAFLACMDLRPSWVEQFGHQDANIGVGVALVRTLQAMIADETDDSLDPAVSEQRSTIALAASAWEARKDIDGALVVHALLRVYWGADL